MIVNYLRMALRQMRRNKLYSIVNIFCLAAGITVALTILLYALHEHSYDRWHKNSARIVVMKTMQSFGAGTREFFNPQLTIVSGPAALQADGSVESMVRTFPGFLGADLQNPSQPSVHFRETKDFRFADSNFFRFFSFRLVKGDPATVLSRPLSIVLTESESKKYFGAVDPIGKTLQLDGKYPLEVTGVAADMPSNSSIKFGLIASLSTMRVVGKYDPYLHDQRIGYGSFSTWLLLRDMRDTARVERNLSRMAVDLEGRTKAVNDYGNMKESHQFLLDPLSNTRPGFAGGASAPYLGPLMLVAGLILALALINYMSLATARASARAKEVGVRKVLGAGRSGLTGQFYTESSVYAVVAFLVGGLLFLFLRGYFYQLVGVKIDRDFVTSPVVIGFFAALFGVVVVIAGSYPSLVLSRFRPVVVLYGKLSRQLGAERVRKGFTVLQFSISMALVICSFFIGKQLYFIRHTDTGVDRENVVMLPFSETMGHFSAYEAELRSLPGIDGVALTMSKMYSEGSTLDMLNIPGRPTEASGLYVDNNFISLLGLKWVEGARAGILRSGTKERILNEEAASAFGLGSRPLGRVVRIDDEDVTVVGVLKNFNFLSLRGPIKPFVFTIVDDPTSKYPDGSQGCVYVKIRAHQPVAGVMESIRKIYSKFDTKSAFQFEFLDDAFDSNYRQEDRLEGLMGVFTTVTVVIACLGLFALATFAAEQRVKEIGIRKVLGASVASIGALLSRDFLRPVALAVVIACPLAGWVMHNWLQQFAYRTPVSGWVFAVCGLGLMGVALATVLARTLGAARVNPVKNLREQ